MKHFTLLSAMAIAILGLASILSTTTVSAIQISINSIAKNPGETANYSQNNSGNAGEFLSAVSILNAGTSTPDVLNAVVTAGTRYASVVGSDSDAFNFASRNDFATSDYRTTFTVTPDNLGNTYSIAINTTRRGALVNREEGGAAGVETIGGVTGMLNNVVLSELSLPSLSSQNTNATAVHNIFQTSTTLTITGLTGIQAFALDFKWNQGTNSGENLLTGGDEAVVLLGLAGTASLIGASDDYPGTASHTQANDGHFVNISATVTQIVPEPSSVALAATGFVGLAAWWRRKRSQVKCN